MSFSVRNSLAENDLTVMSIFVNPAQFAPHEDLATYPRTLPGDLKLLTAQSISVPDPASPHANITRKASALFLPTVQEMYPSGITQDVAAQKGTFIEVKGFGEQMEGKSRPTFFRGVATVVTKLFNAIEVGPGCSNSLSFFLIETFSQQTHILDKKTFSRLFFCDVSAETFSSPTPSQSISTSSLPPAIPLTTWPSPPETHT